MQSPPLPETMKPLFWSYDFPSMDPIKHKKTIIVQVINYGTLDQWRWMVKTYSRAGIQEVLNRVQATEIKPRAAGLASVMLGLHVSQTYVPGGAY